MDKPPKGIMPRRIWLEKRASDLAETLSTHYSAGESPPASWLNELVNLDSEIRSLEKPKLDGKPSEYPGYWLPYELNVRPLHIGREYIIKLGDGRQMKAKWYGDKFAGFRNEQVKTYKEHDK